MLPYSFTLEIVTPEAQLVSCKARQVVIPAREGEMGILPGHAPVVTLLNPGLVRIDNNLNHLPIFVSSGFADIGAEHCIIIAEEAISLDKIQIDRAKERLNRAEKQLELDNTKEHQEALKIAQVLYKIAEQKEQGSFGKVDQTTLET